MQGKKRLQDIPVRYVKGVGPQRADLLQKLGIETVLDLLYYLPRRYEDRSDIVEVKDIVPGKTQGVIGKVLKTSVFSARTGTRIFEIEIGGPGRRLFGVWYNQPFMSNVFSAGQTVALYGKVEVFNRLLMNHPVFEVLDEGCVKDSLDIGRIVPIYSLTEKLTQKYMHKVVFQAIRGHVGEAQDPLPTRLRASRKLVDLKFAIENIHYPHSFENLERAYKRLVFEEFFILQVIMALRRRKVKEKGIRHEVRSDLLSDFEKLFSFELTSDQARCIKEIEKDMSSEKPMYRLLQGDVGSGKTVVSMYALLLTVKNGYQGAIMAPTEILARQHYVTISKTFMPLGVNVRLLINGLDRASRENVEREIADGEADIIVGTHSLFQEGIEYENLGLVIIDEQHKFGVEQAKALRRKGRVPDTLIMTATPIPRSLALTLFGDMDISSLKSKPAGRGNVYTYRVDEDKREAVYGFLRDEVSKGRQAFIVCPRVKKTGASALKSAEETYEHLSGDVFKDLRLALIHGRMKTDEKEKVMDGFRKGERDILVATTVIEVGVDIPNVTVMVIEHAEQYGLAQLHQLRGRIGRGKHESYCILIGAPGTETSRERLSAVVSTDDGFEIAEKDMDIRGPGEFLGTRQSGLPELKFGNIARDFSIMEEARKDAFGLVEEDPALEDPRN
ncbi:MAG: ATP-dependent DNA helicase RecG, partial [Candidatus Omnitrophota bacterium]